MLVLIWCVIWYDRVCYIRHIPTVTDGVSVHRGGYIRYQTPTYSDRGMLMLIGCVNVDRMR